MHERQRHNEKHGSRRIKYLFLVSRKIILQNHASRLLWKSRFMRKKISHFAKKGRSRVTKIPFTTLHKHTACTKTRTPEHHRTPRNTITPRNMTTPRTTTLRNLQRNTATPRNTTEYRNTTEQQDTTEHHGTPKHYGTLRNTGKPNLTVKKIKCNCYLFTHVTGKSLEAGPKI